MPDPSRWIRIGHRVPRVATLSIGLLALFGLSVIRLVLVMAPRDQDVVANGYLDGTAAGILWLGCAICLAVSVEWDAPGREHAWALRTEQVETILREHGGAAP